MVKPLVYSLRIPSCHLLAALDDLILNPFVNKAPNPKWFVKPLDLERHPNNNFISLSIRRHYFPVLHNYKVIKQVLIWLGSYTLPIHVQPVFFVVEIVHVTIECGIEWVGYGGSNLEFPCFYNWLSKNRLLIITCVR